MFSKSYSTLLENINSSILTEYTTFKDILNLQRITCYHSTALDNLSLKTIKDTPMHIGSKLQADFRADFYMCDNEDYDVFYLYKIIVVLKNVYPELVIDDGYNANLDLELQYKNKGYNFIVYKNVGEGNVKHQNLSLVALAPLQSFVSINKIRTYRSKDCNIINTRY